MPEQINAHVDRMLRYIPVTSAHDQIYEEFQKSDDALNIPTKALRYLEQAVRDRARLIILTGDAGHGKTHLCRRLIEIHLGFGEDAARDLINRSCDGATDLTGAPVHEAARILRIHKDFSELSVEDAAAFIRSAGTQDSTTTLICANEGRLRAVLEAAGDNHIAVSVLRRFSESFRDGQVTDGSGIHIVNLNYQSVAAGDDPDGTLLGQTVRKWIDGRKWKACSDCSSKEICPVLHNRNLLAEAEAEHPGRRRAKLVELFATLERLGVVVTIREMLMSVAFLLTGGLSCADVHRQAGRRNWQHTFAFYNLLFDPPRTARHLSKLRVLSELPRLDPGKLASRDVDDRLINSQTVFAGTEMDIRFPNLPGNETDTIDAVNGIDDIVGNARNARERQAEAKRVTTVLRSLRRRAFFDEPEAEGTSLRRLGFSAGDNFRDLLVGDLPPARLAMIKNTLVAGLHAIQGFRMMSGSGSQLFLADPAFGKATAHAAIISRRIQPKDIHILAVRNAWPGDADPEIPQSVDWIDRHVVLRIKSGSRNDDIHLDIMTFECLCRAGGGHVSSDFYAHDLRRVMTFLGRLAERGQGAQETITLFASGTLKSVSIDDGVIQVSEAG